MSYLATPRIVCAGRFLSDVSTRNNVDKNYGAKEAEMDNLWNSLGGAAFELLDCQLTGGAPVQDDDPATGYVLTGSADRASAKMVDLDPDWQMASEIWGLTLRLIDPQSRDVAFSGDFEVASFRDLFTRQLRESRAGRPANGQAAGARYVSTLRDVTWGPAADRSPLLKSLRQATSDGRLSVAMHQFGYFYDQRHPLYRTGTLICIIGPSSAAEPTTVLAGRRLLQATLSDMLGDRPAAIVGAIDFEIDAGRGVASFDVGHAMLIDDYTGKITYLSTLDERLARTKGLAIGLAPDPQSPQSQAPVALGELDVLQPDWYRRSGGIVDLPVPASSLADFVSKPMALYARRPDGSHVLMSREIDDGLLVRTDTFVRRLDPGGSAEVKIHARLFGEPAAGVKIEIRLAAPQGGGAGLGFPGAATTDASGRAVVSLSASDPGNPRGVIDGQIFVLSYGTKLTASDGIDLTRSGLGGLDTIVVHVRDAYPVPDAPEFYQHIRPIMEQYARLYPIMSVHLFDLADYGSLVRYRVPLLLAFQRPMDDPNYMPVTRDLSAAKLATLVKWLSTPTGDADKPLLIAPSAVADATVTIPQDAKMASAIRSSATGFSPDLTRLGKDS